jgi:hypothetical protein
VSEFKRLIGIVVLSAIITGSYFLVKFVYASDMKPNWSDILVKRCVLLNNTYFYMLISNSTECDSIVKWYDSHNGQLVTEKDGKIVLTFENNMTAKEKAFEEGKVENK